MADENYESIVNGVAQHYVSMMPSKDYQMVGRRVPVPDQDLDLGVLRVDFDERWIYSEDIDDGSMEAIKRDLVAENFCDEALVRLTDYSCEATTNMPVNIEPVEDPGYDFYFEDRELLESNIEVQIFFEDLFGVSDIEDEFDVAFLN